jgi:RHS repeat-associated protein
MKRWAFVLLVLAVSFGSNIVFALGDVTDQFYRFVETKNKTVDVQLPGETVDTFTGNLRIVHEDMSFPGKGGLDLKILRTYSSKLWGRSDIASAPDGAFLPGKDPAAIVGLGWTMHMGRLRNPSATGASGCAGGNIPTFEMADGSSRSFHRLNMASTVWTSRDFWLYLPVCTTSLGPGRCVISTSGITYEFANDLNGVTPFGMAINGAETRPVTAIKDLYGNTISITNARGLVNVVTDTYQRTVTFNYLDCVAGATAAGKCLQSLVANGAGGSRTMTYAYTPFTVTPLGSVPRAFLTTVMPALGRPYTYSYFDTAAITNNQYALKQITYPNGGSSAYMYQDVPFFTGLETVPMPVVATRITSGNVPNATWSYAFSSPTTTAQTATVSRPDGFKDVFTYFGFGSLPADASENVWHVGLLDKVERGVNATGIAAETEISTWSQGPLIANTTFPAPAYGGVGLVCLPQHFDLSVNAPFLSSRTVTRDGSSYTTTFTGQDTFGQPTLITETGDPIGTIASVRSTTLEYQPAPTMGSVASKNRVLGRVKKETVCAYGNTTECSETSRTFAGTVGSGAVTDLMDSETVRGVTTKFTYDSDGMLNTVANALTPPQTLTLTLYSNGIPTSIKYNNAYTVTRTVTWDGKVDTETNARGFTTKYTYDALGRIKTVVPPPSLTGVNETSTYNYDNINGTNYTITRGTGTTAYTETMLLDGLGRVVETKNSLTAAERQTTEFDNMGRVVFKSIPFTGTTAAVEIGERTFAFDALSRPLQSSRRILRTATETVGCLEVGKCKTTYSYGANHCRTVSSERNAATDVLSNTTCFQSFGDVNEERLLSVTDANAKVSRFLYDVAGNMTSYVAPMMYGGRTATFTPPGVAGVPAFLPKTDTTQFSGTRTNVSFNAIGQPTSQTDGRGVSTSLGYDTLLSRLITLTYPDPDENVSRTYDRDTLKTVSSTNGGSYTMDYDSLGRVTLQKWLYRAQTYSTGYTYNAAGCLTNIKYPTGSELVMTCDIKNRPITVKRKTGPTTTEDIATLAAYHPAGRLTSVKYGNNRVVSTAIENGRVKSITSTGVMGLTYTYDGNDNVRSITDAVTPTLTASPLEYDSLDRLTSAAKPGQTVTATYDDMGNRTTKVIPALGSTSYSYDAMTGRLVRSVGQGAPMLQSLTYNGAGLLGASDNAAGTAQARYFTDGFGRRVAKKMTNGNIDVVYHYDISGRLMAETLSTGVKIREYFYIADTLVAVDGCIDGFATACTTREYYHSDLVGNVVARTAPSPSGTTTPGVVRARVNYHPWGEDFGTNLNSATRKFNARTFDLNTGFYDYGARMFSPELGRFLSADPVWVSPANAQTANGYSYVLNNPYKYADPQGKFAWLAVTAVLTAAGCGIAAAYYSYNSDAGFSLGKVGEGIVHGAWLGATFGAVAFPAAAVAGTGAAGVGAAGGAAPVLAVAAKALPAPKQIEAAWSATEYKKGGLMTAIEHVFYRHGSDSGFSNVGKFVEGTNTRTVAAYADQALRYGKVVASGSNGFNITHVSEGIVGTDMFGQMTDTVEMWVRDGKIQSIYPK